MIKGRCKGKKKLTVEMGPSAYEIDGERHFIVDLQLDKNFLTMSVWGAKKRKAGLFQGEGPKYFGEKTLTLGYTDD